MKTIKRWIVWADGKRMGVCYTAYHAEQDKRAFELNGMVVTIIEDWGVL